MEAWLGRVHKVNKYGVYIKYNMPYDYKFVPGEYNHLEEEASVIILTDSFNTLVVTSNSYWEWFLSELEPQGGDK